MVKKEQVRAVHEIGYVNPCRAVIEIIESQYFRGKPEIGRIAVDALFASVEEAVRANFAAVAIPEQFIAQDNTQAILFLGADASLVSNQGTDVARMLQTSFWQKGWHLRPLTNLDVLQEYAEWCQQFSNDPDVSVAETANLLLLRAVDAYVQNLELYRLLNHPNVNFIPLDERRNPGMKIENSHSSVHQIILTRVCSRWYVAHEIKGKRPVNPIRRVLSRLSLEQAKSTHWVMLDPSQVGSVILVDRELSNPPKTPLHRKLWQLVDAINVGF